LFVLGGFQWKLLRLLLTGNTLETNSISDPDAEQLIKNQPSIKDEPVQSLYHHAQYLFFCCAGLQVSYLVWGVLQEKIMTKYISKNNYFKFSNLFSNLSNCREYLDGDKVEKFTDSQFLVFVNRILAFAFSGIYLLVRARQNIHRTPLYKYSFCSISNTLSSWCQYEALKFISFPTQVMTKSIILQHGFNNLLRICAVCLQVLAKSAKVIPVMLMGKLVSRTQYKNYEYATALLISIGMTAFLLGSSEGKKGKTQKILYHPVSLSGVLQLAR
jgi:adenosine 3'-phospho 5'-phosphosulfate transporter B2